jgi:hypothetical protein
MTRRRHLSVCLLLCLILPGTLAAQDWPELPPNLPDEDKLYGLSVVWQEVNYNFAFFDQVPDLDWDSAYRAFISQVLATESSYDYYQTLKRFVALLEDGHTRVWLRGVAGVYESYPWVLTQNVEGRVLVTNVGRSLENELPVFSVIETIDGEPAAERAQREHGPYTFASTDHDRANRILERALYGPPDEPVHITFVTPEGDEGELKLERDRRTREDEWLLPTSSDRPRFEFRWLDGEIAYMALNTFNDPGVVDDFQAVLPELYGAKALVIDIRNNGGGNSSNGYKIAAYLTDDTLETSAWKTRENVAAFKAWGRYNERYQAYNDMNAWHDGGTHGELEPAEGRRLIVPTVVLQENATYRAAGRWLREHLHKTGHLSRRPRLRRDRHRARHLRRADDRGCAAGQGPGPRSRGGTVEGVVRIESRSTKTTYKRQALRAAITLGARRS